MTRPQADTFETCDINEREELVFEPAAAVVAIEEHVEAYFVTVPVWPPAYPAGIPVVAPGITRSCIAAAVDAKTTVDLEVGAGLWVDDFE